jgi:2-polyprenyl-6-methoxyphenol hydroxylase-like FAD-dependent oxidoreductase
MTRSILSLNVRNVPVLVVGAGPAGLVAGITLARYGVEVLVIDKRPETSELSRNLVISTRGMELMRRFGLEDQVRAGAPEVEPCAWVTPNLRSGLGRPMALGYPSTQEAAAVSPTRPAWAPQDHHEPILLAHLRRAPTATVRFGTELVDLHPADQHIRATLRDDADGTARTLEARYLIAADGAHSTVRQQLGVTLRGPDDLALYERIEFRAPLADAVGPHRYALYVISEPAAAGVLAPRGTTDRWSLSRERTVDQERFDQLGHDELVTFLRAATGVDDLRPDIERTTTFAFAAQIADHYRHGRCFLTGDAAHRMTPRGGTGMNTAIQDGYDLGWKLAWVLHGWTPDTLLDTYDAERRPVGLHNVERASQPQGANQTPDEALPWDLNGRVLHHWTDDAHRTSTIDLLGDGLTLLTGAAATARIHIDGATAPPIDVHTLDRPVAESLGIAPNGAVLLRPDGHEITRWTDLATASINADALSAAH